MSTILKINYLISTDLPEIGNITKIIVAADRVLEIKCHDSGGQLLNQRYDFSSAVSKSESCESPNVYSDLIYRYLIEDDDLTLWIACVVPDDTKLPIPAYQEYIVNDFPKTIFLAEGVPDGSEIITNSPSWVSELSTLTYAEKQQRAVAEVKEWRNQKEEWIENASRYIDLNPDIPKHIGYWMRSADRVIQKFFQDPDIDPLIVAEMAKQATKGPSTYDPDNPSMLFRNLLSVINTFPNGPDFSAIWVETLNLNSAADVERKTILQVLQTRSTQQNETYDLPSDYDSTETDWIVENQVGIVTYDNDSPASGDSITSTLTDHDGGIENIRYRWQEQSQDGSWSNMSGQSNRRQQWTVGTAGTYRCRVIYNDNYQDNNDAFGASFTIA